MKYKSTFVRLLILLLLWPVAMNAQEQSAKRIFITLDVSKSMDRNNKYVVANYTAQAISVFSNSNDKLIVYYLGEKHEFSNNDGYKKLHISYESLPSRKATYHEISDLLRFMNDYKPDAKYQDWLFIIGDGHWDWDGALNDYNRATAEFSDFIDKNEIHVCYLQTGEVLTNPYAFTTYLESMASPKVDARRSDTTGSSVMNQCTYFANKILGFSNTSVNIEQESEQCVSFSSEFPLNRFLLVHQSQRLAEGDLNVESAEFSGNSIPFKLKGNPTTKPLVKRGAPFLSGSVWEIDYKQTIPANEKVKVCFNQKVDVANLNLYPYVDVVLNVTPHSTETGPLNKLKKNYFEICKKEGQVVIVLEATDSQGRKFEPPLMQKMDVGVFVGGDVRRASFRASDTTFVVTLPMPDETLSYYATVESPGYFSRITETQTVVKSENCPLEKAPMITLPVQSFDPVPFKDLIDGRDFGGVIVDTMFQQLCENGGFDVQEVESSSAWYSEKPTLSLDGNHIRLIHKPNSKWCECAYPDLLQYTVTLRSSSGIPMGEYLYEGFTIPITVPVDKRGWVIRCKDYLIVGGSLLLFIIYLVALLKKKRFKKSARIIPTYMELKGGVFRENKNDKGRSLRKKTFGAWFRRWLDPFTDEKRFMEWQTPPAGYITFVADKSKDKVNITRASYNSAKMRMATFDPDNNSKIIEMDDIQVYSGKKYEGKLFFEPGGINDENGYRLFVIMLILASIVAEGFVLFTLIKAIL